MVDEMQSHSQSRFTSYVLSAPVLVLNQNFEPLNVCSTRRALTLVLTSKAEVLEISDEEAHSATSVLECPSVIRLQSLVRRPHKRVPLSRHEIFRRDGYTCQYCGKRTNHLTLDHVLPRSKGGLNSWTNLVSACSECNHRKGRRTPEQARMPLRSVPREPRANPYATLRRFTSDGKPMEAWSAYLPG